MEKLNLIKVYWGFYFKHSAMYFINFSTSIILLKQ